MNLQSYIDRLSQSSAVISSLVQGVTPEQARWKPSPDCWSILEVINHLGDEERDDFRNRLDYLLNRPGQPLPPIDPPRWAVERKYNERDLGESLERFLNERRQSLQWLENLRDPNWEQTHQLPHGPIRAGDILASWAAHDLLHIRQLTKRHYEYLNRASSPFQTEYAGNW
jgi:hypothetical protein